MTSGASGEMKASTVFEAADELQAGPDFGDGADLHIHEAGGEADVAHHVFGKVGGDARRFLRPAYPEHSGRGERLHRALKFPVQVRPRFRKDYGEVEGRIGVRDYFARSEEHTSELQSP